VISLRRFRSPQPFADHNQDALIAAVAAANPKTVLVLMDGDAVLMPWINQVPAILEAWYPGEEDGNVVAELLFGLTNPSGHLSITYPVNAADVPASTPAQWPGVTVRALDPKWERNNHQCTHGDLLRRSEDRLSLVTDNQTSRRSSGSGMVCRTTTILRNRISRLRRGQRWERCPTR